MQPIFAQNPLSQNVLLAGYIIWAATEVILGIRQTEHLRDRLARTGEIKADVLIASPMRQAKESAEILAPTLDTPIVFEKGFEEWVCDDGTLPPEEFSVRWSQVPETQKPFFRFMVGYETGLEFSGRIHTSTIPLSRPSSFTLQCDEPLVHRSLLEQQRK